MPNDKDPACPKCGETTLHPNEYHSGLKLSRKTINGIALLLVYCANCGAIVGVTKE